MKRICLILAVLLCLAAVQSFAEYDDDHFTLFPYDISEPWIDLENGVFCCSIQNPDTVAADGVLTLNLYLEDRYNTDVLMALFPGDRVWVAGELLTVKEITLHEVDTKAGYEFELIPEEDVFSYVVFVPLTNGACTVIVDDWSPVVDVGSIDIALPLLNKFRYVAYEAGYALDPAGEEGLLKALAEFGSSFVPYNTTCVIVNGKLWELDHYPYPEGPETEADQMAEVPVWKFCHAKSPDGLETAVITCSVLDCEVGPVPAQDVTEEDLEEMRQLALHGVVTELDNDTMVTGGTWIYTFETPDGEYLMSIEMYKGWIVGPYGMYNYRIRN